MVDVAAIEDAVGRLSHLNEMRIARGESVLEAGFALHAGDIAWGNIGGRLRLDFTAIGPAVNHASRLLELAKRLRVRAAISQRFQSESAMPLPSLGTHGLRDVADRQEIFALPA